MSRLNGQWINTVSVEGKSFICGHCGNSISSDKSYELRLPSGTRHYPLYICHTCNRPTYIYNDEMTPSAKLGNSVQNLPKDISALYEEIRGASSVNAYTASVLAARKLLMHIAVEKGAEENKTFVYYVDYLETKHYTPPGSNKWVDSIRKLGNDANHEIVIMSQEQARRILTFLEMLLKFIYEFPDEMSGEDDETADEN